jgi:hypothetical protein
MLPLTVLISSRAGTRSLAGWQCIRQELRRMPLGSSGWRPRSPLVSSSSRVDAISLNLKRLNIEPDRRLQSADNVRPRATHRRPGANDARHRQLHAVEPWNRDNNSEPRGGRHPARNAKIRTDRIPDLLRCNRKCASGNLASVAANCEHSPIG